jgi:1-deoxyxylulose-5-phosphate synthase
MKLLAFQRNNGLASFISMQSQYNLIIRDDEEQLIPLCREEGVGLTPWSPLARGRLAATQSVETLRAGTDEQSVQWYQGTGGVDETVASVGVLPKARGVSPAQIALAWVLAKPDITSPIVGMSKPHHLPDALGALSLELSSDEMIKLETAIDANRRAPHW